MGPAQAIGIGLLRSFRFSGRASRSEFCWFALIVLFGAIVIVSLGGEAMQGPALVAIPILFLPIGGRRFRDTGLSSWLFRIPLSISTLGMLMAFTGYLDFNFAETTGGSQSVFSVNGIRSTSLLMLVILGTPILWAALLLFCASSTIGNPADTVPTPPEVPR